MVEHAGPQRQRWPFEILLQTDSAVGPRSPLFEADTTFSSDGYSAKASDLVNPGVHELDRGYLVTLADPKSDLRILLILDSHLQRSRLRVVNSAIAVVGTLPASRALLAVHTTNRTDLVTYQWAWKAS